MSLPLPLALCLGGVFCCSPLALYFLWLASISRRSRPVVVTGRWDFVAVLLGLGGFLYAGSLAVSAAGSAALVGRGPDSFPAAYQAVGRATTAGPDAAFAYRCVVAAAVLAAAWWRRDSLSVYNVAPSALSAAVNSAAAAVGLVENPSALSWSPHTGFGTATVAVRRLDPAVTAELLAHLRSRLATSPAGDGRPSGWFTFVAAALIGGSFLLIGIFVRHTRLI